ncbi:MAG: S8 family serine peptidase, partial [Verrucomicrobia subdivision 3 bacterium]|nr:S8 family serine peptidase [Limisphaerales bacterium]
MQNAKWETAGRLRLLKINLLVLNGAGRFLLLLATFGLGAGPLSAQTSFVTLGNAKAHPTQILAKYKEQVILEQSGNVLQQAGSRVQHRYQMLPQLVLLDPTGPATGDDEAALRTRLIQRINDLKRTGLFEYVEPDYLVEANALPTDQAFVDGSLWGLRNTGQDGGVAGADIAATTAWDLTTGSTNVIVAVIDTGIRYTHRDLTNQMWRNPGESGGGKETNGKDDDADGFIDNVYGINAITGSGNPMDDNDHGTHCAGTIGAAANNGNPHVGVTWRVRLMGCKFLSASGSGANSAAIKCIDFAVAKGAKILSNSWGGGGNSQALYDAINNARTKGVLFIAAAGNNASDNDAGPFYPANYPLDNIVSVAALTRNDLLADFSNYGRTTVDLGAPGDTIYSSTAASDTSYDYFSGTSMAAPHVSGVAALILSRYPAADLAELRDRLLLGTVPIPALNGVCTTGGRLNAYNSLTVSGSGIVQVSVNPPSGATLLRSSSQPIYVTVTDLFGVTDATVTASISGSTNLTFRNDGVTPDAVASNGVYSALFAVPAATNPVTLTVTVSAPGKVGATNVVTYAVLPPPPNDYFTNATKVPSGGGLYLENNRFATMETALGEPPPAGVSSAAGSLWWAWTPVSSTNVFVDTTGSSIDTVLAVYTNNT